MIGSRGHAVRPHPTIDRFVPEGKQQWCAPNSRSMDHLLAKPLENPAQPVRRASSNRWISVTMQNYRQKSKNERGM
jgi:hypothetical protein